MKTIVIGAGYFGINYVRELGNNVVAVIEPDKSRANYVADTYGVAVYEVIPSSLNYDAAIIVTPPDTHVELAHQVAKTGRYVLIEKPAAASVQELLQLRRFKDKIMSGLIYLYNPSFLSWVDQLADMKEINHIFARRTNDGPVRTWQDAMWDLAAHDISMLNYIAGQEPDFLSKLGGRDYTILQLGYHHLTALVYVSWRGGPKVRKLEAVPFQGDRLVFDDMAVVHKVSPLRLMLNEFLSGKWSDKASFDAGLAVVNVLEKLS